MKQEIAGPATTQDRTLRAIWLAMLVSPGIYLMLGRLLKDVPTPAIPAPWNTELLLNISYGAAIVLFAVTMFLKARNSDPAIPVPGIAREDAGSGVFVRTLLIFASAESIGLIALVLFWLIRDRNSFHLLLATSLAALVIHRPPMRPDAGKP